MMRSKRKTSPRPIIPQTEFDRANQLSSWDQTEAEPSGTMD
jgi:CheY-like chemotaxis protein